jgi:lipoprotein-anchoring transpeptidase ErfK/SrfK
MRPATKRPLARLLISVAMAVAFAGAAPLSAFAETGVDPAANAPFFDDASSDDSAIDFAPGFKDYETDVELDSLKKSRAFTFDETSIQNPTAAARPAKWIEVVLARQMIYAWQNGKVVMSSRISSGLPRTPTVRGNFRIYVKYVSTRMRGPGYNLPNVPYTMYFYRGYGIHGAYWHNNFGRPMSHGCVNLPVPFSGQLFRWAPVGTLVYIH